MIDANVFYLLGPIARAIVEMTMEMGFPCMEMGLRLHLGNGGGKEWKCHARPT